MDAIERLSALLDEEVVVGRALADVLREEQEAVVRLRPEAILLCLMQRGQLQDRMQALATERRALVTTIGNAHGTDAARVTDLLPALPPRAQRHVRDRVRRLRTALLEARNLEQQNALLARSSLEHVGEVLQALRGLVPGVRYGADATLTVPEGPERLSHRA